jgi:hypothetical protein
MVLIRTGRDMKVKPDYNIDRSRQAYSGGEGSRIDREEKLTMDFKPIKNKRDHRRVLKGIDALMDAKANTSAGERLDLLVTLAEAWESKHHPIDPIDPVEAIRFCGIGWSRVGPGVLSPEGQRCIELLKTKPGKAGKE